MNVTLQLHGERTVYPVPPGLHELMSDIAREVLRDQPAQLYQYIADQLETMVKVRQYSRMAGELVDDVIGENVELLAYVRSLGMSLEEANKAANIIQRAFRVLKCRREVKRKYDEVKEKADFKSGLGTSVSFQDFLKSADVDFKISSKTSSLLVESYRYYKAEKLGVQHKSRKHKSTHTIDTFLPKPTHPLVQERDSKLLTYQESPRPSFASGWLSSMPSIYEKQVGKVSFEKSLTEFVFEHEPLQSERYSKYLGDTTHRTSTLDHGLPEGLIQLPSYVDERTSHMPMISQSGQLGTSKESDTDIITLYSGNSEVEDNISWGQTKVPSQVTDLRSEAKQDMADELFNIIERRTSDVSRFVRETEGIDDKMKKEVADAVKMDLRSISKSVSQKTNVSHKQSKLPSEKKSKPKSIKGEMLRKLESAILKSSDHRKPS